jgi:hypothetical protein
MTHRSGRIDYVAVLIGMAIATIGSAPAAVDVRWTHNGRHSEPVWLPGARDHKKISDPIGSVFKDKFYRGDEIAHDDSGQAVTDHTCGSLEHRYRCQIQILIDELWDGSAIPNGYRRGGDWYNHDKVNGPRPVNTGPDKACANHRLTVLFRTPPKFSPYAVEGENNGGNGSTTAACIGNQYHARFWVDSGHQNIQPAHDGLGSWVLVGFHHEKVRSFHHHIDVPWDQAQYAMNRALHRLCQYGRWGIHDRGRFKYGDFRWSGRMTRLTTRETRGGCANA